MKFFIIFLAMLAACGGKDGKPKIEIEYAKEPAKEDLSSLAARAETETAELQRWLLAGYVGNFVDGQLVSDQDSLLLTAIGFGVLPCSVGATMFDAVRSSAKARAGALIRTEPPTPGMIGNMTSRDMEVGAMFGLARYAKRCNREAVTELWSGHMSWLGDSVFLHPDAIPDRAAITAPIRYTQWSLSAFLGLRAGPTQFHQVVTENAILVDAVRIVRGREACYPVHLSTLQYLTQFETGRPPTVTAMDGFCAETKAGALPLTEWLCGRLSAREWLTADRNEWWYAHQKCHDWQQPDGPGARIDWLILYGLAKQED